MEVNFWSTLKRPIMALAPLADVTDPSFRRIIAKYGKPDVMFTEFISADGLAMAPEEGRKKLLADLQYSESERPIVAQFFTSIPAHMEKAAELARELGFDGMDINMGCPHDAIVRQSCGAALIKNPALARELVRAAKSGFKGPVSIKTRLGYNKDELDTWLPELLAEEPAVVTIHARTRKEMSLVPARWERVARAVEIRNELQSSTLILGNGDVADVAHADTLCAETGADGAMLGRAIFGNPFLFSEKKRPEGTEGQKLQLSVLVEHTKLFEELLPHKSFALMKKHYKSYVSGFDGASDLRARLMEAEDAVAVEKIVTEFCGTV